ncbi:MAG: hypothetical protein JNN07_24160 [Verrucomicrobiales bacterium]|nr:hypothetical protein [Verrucomicrobiales bacterium]
MKRVWTSKVLIAFTTLLVLAAFGVFLFVWPPDHTEVRNQSGQTVTDVVLQLRDHNSNSSWGVTRRAATLEPGESLRVRHSHNDSTAVVEFGLGGRRFRHDNGYVDLWAGEGYRFDIQPDGSVKAGYDHRDRP